MSYTLRQNEKHHRIPDMKLVTTKKRYVYSLEAYNTRKLKPVMLEHTKNRDMLLTLIEKALKTNANIILVRVVR